jgi:hypothetical protein
VKSARLLLWFLLPALTADAQIRFVQTQPEVIRARLERAAKKNPERRNALLALFREAGCAEQLLEQPVKRSRLPNIICTLSGSSDSVLIVGAHYDKVDEGLGVIDNWSGAALLPSLYESLKQEPRSMTIVFIGFSDEEKGLVGSKFYAKSLTKEEVSRIKAMVNLDTLGLSDTKVWKKQADPRLLQALAHVAHSMGLPVRGLDFDQVGTSDSESFAELKVPRMTIHSLTQETWTLLHTSKDQLKEIKQTEYFQTYRLLAGYIAFLDHFLTATLPPGKNDPAQVQRPPAEKK